MTPEMWDRLGPFRDEASARAIPADDVERWLDTARPCVTLTRTGEGERQEIGPVAGRFGGPLLLPPEVPDPAHPFVASIDLTALPADATDPPLPPDGHLLLFAFPETADDYESQGSAIHVPAGTAVTERDRNAWNTFDFEDEEAMFKAFPQGPLRATAGVSLPYHHAVESTRADELVQVWNTIQDAITSQAPSNSGDTPGRRPSTPIRSPSPRTAPGKRRKRADGPARSRPTPRTGSSSPTGRQAWTWRAGRARPSTGRSNARTLPRAASTGRSPRCSGTPEVWPTSSPSGV
ncbi:hypothetical protein ACQ86D_34285 [Streptomyces galilaeus]